MYPFVDALIIAQTASQYMVQKTGLGWTKGQLRAHLCRDKKSSHYIVGKALASYSCCRGL